MRLIESLRLSVAALNVIADFFLFSVAEIDSRLWQDKPELVSKSPRRALTSHVLRSWKEPHAIVNHL
jgi:hypothetical protein